MFNFRKKPSSANHSISSLPDEADKSIPSPHAPLLPWLANLSHIEDEKKVEPPSYPPSLIIGLGETGKVVLHQIKETLCEWYPGGNPNNVRLIFLESPQIKAPPLLVKEEIIPWPDLPQPDYSHLARFPFFGWLDSSQRQPSDRQRMRAQLIWAHLQSRSQSQLFSCLQASLRGWTARDIPNVYFVANLAEAESAFLWDIVYLLRNQAARDSGLQLRSGQSFALLSLDYPPHRFAQGEGELYSALRELSRFTYKTPSLFTYPEPIFDGIDEGPLVDFCFLVSQSSQSQASTLAAAPFSEGSARAISEALLVLIEPSAQSIDQHLRDAGSRTADVRLSMSQTFISSLGIASVVFPTKEIRRALELRLLKSVWFASLAEQPNPGILPLQPGSESPETPDTTNQDSYRTALSFLENEQVSGTHNHHFAFSIAAQSVRSTKWQTKQTSFPPQLDRLYAAKLAEWITIHLNGGDLRSFSSSSNRLLPLQQQLHQLCLILDTAYTLAGRSSSPGRTHIAAQQRIAEWKKFTTQVVEELKLWIEALAGKPEEKTSARRSAHRSIQNAKVSSLHALIENDWLDARSQLLAAAQAPIRRAFFEQGSNTPPYSGLEEPFYRKYLQPNLTGASGSSSLLDRFIQRIGWLCKEVDGQLQLFLLVVPSGCRDPQLANTSSINSDIIFRKDQIPEIYEHLQALAQVYSRKVYSEKFETLLDQKYWNDVSSHLGSGRDPLLPFQRFYTVQDALPVPSENIEYIVSQDLRLSEKVRSHLFPYQPQHLQRGRIEDPTQFPLVLLSLHHKIALESASSVIKEEADYNFLTDHHIFLAEQTAAKAEKKLQSLRSDLSQNQKVYLHPLFISLLQSGALVDLFLRSWIYRLTTYSSRSQSWTVRAVGGFGPVTLNSPSDDLLTGLELFAITAPYVIKLHNQDPLHFHNRKEYEACLSQAIREEAQASREARKTRFTEIKKDIIPALMVQRDVRVKSLANYLIYLLDEEQYGGL
jgi:hypothetical protein